MEWTSAEVVGVITYLLPGFLTAWIFYGLTAHPRKTPFERVVQALIFTTIVQAITAVTQSALQFGTRLYSFGDWTKDTALIWALINATLLGLVFALFADKDWFHQALRAIGATTRTSYPSEWFSSFHRERRYVILHLVGERRLYGWPYEWPDQSRRGHFVIAEPSWILDDNSCAPLHTVERIIIPVAEVEMVELLKRDNEISASDDELREVEQRLIGLRETGATENGKQSAATAAKSRAELQHNERAGRDGQPAARAATAEHTATTASQEIRK